MLAGDHDGVQRKKTKCTSNVQEPFLYIAIQKQGVPKISTGLINFQSTLAWLTFITKVNNLHE
jgi:hypothetical protein